MNHGFAVRAPSQRSAYPAGASRSAARVLRHATALSRSHRHTRHRSLHRSPRCSNTIPGTRRLSRSVNVKSVAVRFARVLALARKRGCELTSQAVAHEERAAASGRQYDTRATKVERWRTWQKLTRNPHHSLHRNLFQNHHPSSCQPSYLRPYHPPTPSRHHDGHDARTLGHR